MIFRVLIASCFFILCFVSRVSLGDNSQEPKQQLRSAPLPQHSLLPPYIDDWWQEGVPHWDIGGDTVVTDQFIRLTPQKQGRFGWIWNQHPMEGLTSWELSASFFVRSRRNPGADGIAFWIVSAPEKPKDPGPLFGMTGNFIGVGVMFDSYDNNNLRDNPAAVLVTQGVKEREVAEARSKGLTQPPTNANKWDPGTDFANSAEFSCVMDYRNSGVSPMEMVLTYDQLQKRLTLRLKNKAKGVYIVCGEVSGIEMPILSYIGATATTGGVMDNHDLVSVELRAIGDNTNVNGVSHFDHTAEQNQKAFWESPEGKKQAAR